MGMVNKVICEKDLPIPWEDFSEEEKTFFNSLKWDEIDFYTTSFVDYGIEENTFPTYTITEDGQFYKSLTKVIAKKDKEGNMAYDEIPAGIEKQDFTGEIYFGASILGEEHDYEISFKVLFYKGDLKELEPESWKKISSEERKRLAEKLSQAFLDSAGKKPPILNRVLLYFTYLTKLILFWLFRATVRIETWVSR